MAIAATVKQAMQEASWIRKMFERGAELRRQVGAENVYDWTLGNPILEPPAQFFDALADLSRRRNEGLHRYMPNAGFMSVRDAIAAKLRRDRVFEQIDGNTIIMSVGAGGALNATLKAVLDPGEEVIVLAPYFVEYLFYIRNHGGVPVVAETDEQFNVDLAALEACITPRTKAVLINSPNNPTGRVYPRATLIAVGELLAAEERRRGHPIYLLTDEPYRELVYGGQPVTTAADVHANSLLVYSWSKSLSIPGERIGFVAINPEADDPLGLADAITFTTRTLGFVNAPATLQLAVASLLDVTVDIGWYHTRRDRLLSGLRAIGIDVVTPEGTFYMFPRSPDPDDVAFVDRALQERVLLVPGRGFGRAGHFRISYAVDDASIEGGLAALTRVMRRRA